MLSHAKRWSLRDVRIQVPAGSEQVPSGLWEKLPALSNKQLIVKLETKNQARRLKARYRVSSISSQLKFNVVQIRLAGLIQPTSFRRELLSLWGNHTLEVRRFSSVTMAAAGVQEGLDLLEQTRRGFQSKLHAFAASPADLILVRQTPAHQPPARDTPLKTLYVLDSSFNPPSLAHRRIATAALTQEPDASPKRLLLLLATQNADKPTKPAPFEDRLVMMCLFAQDLHDELKAQGLDAENLPPIDVGITKKPYFNDKAMAIDQANIYPEGTQQVHLTGYDTFVRIFDTKYYEPDHTLARLEPFLSQHRLRVTYRPGDSWGEKEEQDRYLENMASGGLEDKGGKREWASQIKFVEGKKDDEEAVSSTKAREAAKSGDHTDLDKYVTTSIKIWMMAKGLYL